MGSRVAAALVAGFVVAVASTAAAQRGEDPPPSVPRSDKLVYADFEGVDNGKALSARGGPITVTSYQESDMHRTTTKGGPAGNSPELVRIKPEDPNHLGKFEFAFMAPNQWAGAGMEIKGRADADGKPQTDDVSGYKKITLQLYAKGADMIRIEAISRGLGNDLPSYPQMSFKVRPGLNTYEVALNALAQPRWVEIKEDSKKVLQKLTALNVTAYCEPCRPAEGMVLVDNVVFEK